MVAFCLCEGCEKDPPEHCHATKDVHTEWPVIGGFHCSCECAMEARRKKAFGL